MSDLIKIFNDHTFEECISIIKNMLELGELREGENGIVAIWTAGWSKDENIIACLRDYGCKHRYNYIGHVYAVSYFARDIDKKYDYDYEIVAEPKKKDS